MKKLDPTPFGLNSRTDLQQVDERTIAIVKKIKSRIIRKDAEKIVAMADTIQEKEPGQKVILVCTSNICSKSKALLKEKNIDIQIEE
ncbi:hypothetical protein ACE01N_04160 [Saccharicrinis sp. FJH2]|uniref:hypothetical protein n=1 Tax=Saccharicrinis sp. FJH65 TaxID=3344659 RepID=UPI0035F2F3C6